MHEESLDNDGQRLGDCGRDNSRHQGACEQGTEAVVDKRRGKLGRSDKEWAAAWLSSLVGDCKVKSYKKGRYKYLTFGASSSEALAEIIKPYVPDCMSYKIRDDRISGPRYASRTRL